MTRFNSYTRRGGFFIYCIETNTESNRMKKQKNMLQMKENKTPEKGLNEMEISD